MAEILKMLRAETLQLRPILEEFPLAPETFRECKSILRDRMESLKLDGIDRQRRGYEFEKLICLLLALEGLDPAPAHKLAGEQVDGFFVHNARYFLLECKWEHGQRPASDLYEFRGKVDGRLAGTLGVFVSMSGFSDDAPKALRYGKEINVILFDDSDVDYSFHPDYSFSKVLELKLRRAAQFGEVYYVFKRHLDELGA